MATSLQLGQESSEDPGSGGLFGPRGKSFRGYYHYSRSSAWQPAVNIYEDETSFHICAELAGLDKDEVAVNVTGHRIEIQGERSVPLPCAPPRAESILRMEIDSGPFIRSIELPERADMSTATARLDKGFLWITIAKIRA